MSVERKINILMIGEDAAFCLDFEKLLEAAHAFQFSLRHVESIEEAEKAVAEEEFHAIVLELCLSANGGLNHLKLVRAMEPNLPVIVLADDNDVELAVTAVRYGAEDYLIKHKIDPHHFFLAIRYAVEKKQVERFHREQIHFLQSVMDNVPSPLYIKDTNLIFGACNAAFEELLGLSKDEIIGKSVLDIFEGDVGEIIRGKELELLGGVRHKVYELAIDREDKTVSLMFHETVHKRADGMSAGLIGVGMDISKMKSVEKSLKDAKNSLEQKVNERTSELLVAIEELKDQMKKKRVVEKQLYMERRILMNGPFVAFRVPISKKRKRIEYVSQNIRKYGYSVDDFINGGIDYLDLVHNDHRDNVVKNIMKHIHNKSESTEFQFLLRNKNGSFTDVCCYIHIFRNSKMTPVYFDGYLWDRKT